MVPEADRLDRKRIRRSQNKKTMAITTQFRRVTDLLYLFGESYAIERR